MTDRLAYSIKEAAEAVGLSETIIRRAYRTGELPAHFVTSTKPTILRADLLAWIANAPTERSA